MYICAGNQRITFRYERTVKTETGYSLKKRYYQCDAYDSYPLKSQCTKSQNNRQIGVSVALLEHKQRARENLRSERGRKLSAQRMVEVESVFCHAKGNRVFRRFLLRDFPKVHIEMGLVSVAHNLLKLVAFLA
ncbi:transposase [Alicyclobacillus acidoterrestris]|uniref:transposase n=1 Tax=Alicyclobacillus acidoterrestris TaxID=1450 RepID=UPI0013780AEF